MNCKSTKTVSSSELVVNTAMWKAVSVVLFIITSLICFSISSSPVRAEITRGCEGRFILQVAKYNGEAMVGNQGNRKILEVLEGRGACKNKTKANDCRRRAKDNIFRCANEIWDNRKYLIGDPDDNKADLALPAICRGDVTGARKVSFKTNPHGKATDIQYAIKHKACCQMKPNAKSLVMNLSVDSLGDKGCGSPPDFDGVYFDTLVLDDNYKVNCTRLRDMGMCGAPPRRSTAGERK